MIIRSEIFETWICVLTPICAAILMAFPAHVAGVGCYVCNSMNGSDATCGDPYNPSNGTYVDDCMDGKPGYEGLFPTRYCIKMSGYRWSTDLMEFIYLYIRRCAVESLGHAKGTFVWGGHTYTGSILTCDYDGCNSTSRLKSTEAFPVFLASAAVLAWMHIRWSHCFAY
ncbi:hypothetical protein BV898_02956 [Hypsibius exemplaris]|uniref:Protein quiver n=1 Tax=Hypsibius exemplaris TaxID=2072580 RepID=A0A1W0X6S4_HYPEX|nr:hypothetical protein BV898_02956 [Hypsibius exemplaris]